MSAEKTKPTLLVGDNAYPVAVDINTLCDVESAFGLAIPRVVLRFTDGDNVAVEDYRRFLEVTLRKQDGTPLAPDTTAAKTVARELIALAGLFACKEAVGSALLAVMQALNGSAGAVPDKA